MQPKPPRPTGVTILAVLAILGGLGSIALGGLLLAASAIIGTLNLAVTYPALANAGLTIGTVAILLGVIGAVLLILGILDLVVGIGFLGGKSWAWTLGMVVAVISIIISIAQIPISGAGVILPLVIWIVILYYLTRPRVKAFFGKAPGGPTPSMGSPMMGTGAATAMGSSSTGATMIRCSSCGAMAPAGTMTCPSCGASL